VDSTLSGAPVAVSDVHADAAMQQDQGGSGAMAVATGEIGIDNFSFAPSPMTVPVGTRVTWVNRDDVPHQIVSTEKRFASSPVLDTNQRYSYAFTSPGTYAYFCSIHPRMTGTIVARWRGARGSASPLRPPRATFRASPHPTSPTP